MSAIVLEADLTERLIETAQVRDIQPNDLLEQAVRTYLRQIDRETIRSEVEAFRRMHSALVQQFLHQWVAIHRGEVVDSDADFQSLHQRIRDRYGRFPVLLRRVEPEIEREMLFRTPHFER